MLRLPLFLHLLLLLFFNLSAASPLYQTFLRCLQNHSDPNQLTSNIVFDPTNISYSSLLRAYIRNARFNTSSTPKPTFIITPLHESHLQFTLICAKSSALHIRIRSGGHDFEGLSYASVSPSPFILIDMFNLRSIAVDLQSRSAWVQAGATLGELYYRIWEQSKLHGFPAGVCPTVGVGGHISGGGYGNMLRKFGLSVDHVVDARIVDANGRIVDRKMMGEDLFWAIRGGGGASFGVILAYKIQLVPVPETVTVFRLQRTLEDNGTDMVYRWQHIAPNTDSDLFMRLLLQPIYSKPKKTVRASVYTLFLGRADRLLSILKRDFPELGLKKEDCIEMGWIESVIWWANYEHGTSLRVLLGRSPGLAHFQKRKSDYVQTPISKDGLELLWKKLMELDKTELVFNPYGGKMNEISALDTAFPRRAGNLFKIQYSVSWKEQGIEAEKSHVNQLQLLYNFLTPYVSKNPRTAYFNYRDLDIGTNHNYDAANSFEEGKVYGIKYFKENFERLVRVKTAVDPQNFFRDEQSIPAFPKLQSSGLSWSGGWRLTMVAIFMFTAQLL
ncbi:hypothetical protein IC575_018159 [Cucumis melo]|uniref:Reticuline oxidase-like protein n=1 Tax=Cucumis melo TaxID=3656 RepID=A0A1S3AYK0_CUCME|nr:berberine bridge enzyme-like 21 [Cucumis melo]